MKRFIASLFIGFSLSAYADENLLGYVRGAETLPEDALEVYEVITSRNGKAQGSYHAIDSKTEVEYGVTPRFSVSGAFFMQSIHLSGLEVDGYLPRAVSYGLQPSAVEAAAKYNFLSPVKDVIGLSTYFAIHYGWLDPHSGQGKETVSQEIHFLLQKYFGDDLWVWNGNLGMESTQATRKHVDSLDPAFDWPTTPEMEIEYILGTGVSYRFIENWFVGAEALYETEYETEIGRERWSIFAGPSLHYGGPKWWSTITYIQQVEGGGEKFAGQPNGLHLIEKTENEVRFKLGMNF